MGNRCWLTFWTGTNGAPLKQLVLRMTAGYFVGWRRTNSSCPSFLFSSIDFSLWRSFCLLGHVVRFNSHQTMNCKSLLHIIKGCVFDFCLVPVHFYSQVLLYWLWLSKAHSMLCSPVSFILFPRAIGFALYQGHFGHCKGTFAPLISFVQAVSCCLTGAPRAFTGQEVAALYLEKVSRLGRLDCWKMFWWKN